MLAHTALPADGFTARWQTWDAAHSEVLTLRWENEGWTASGEVERERIHYVIRLSPLWQIRQMLLFRDLEEPDLWLATDGSGHWGEMNGAHRTELDGCRDLHLDCTAFTLGLPIRRLPVDVGDSFEIPIVEVDTETLGVTRTTRHYQRISERSWECTLSGTQTLSFACDEYGLILDHEGRFRRY